MGKTFSLISPETGFLACEEIRVFLSAILLGIAIGLYLCIKYSVAKALSLRGFCLGVCDFISAVAITAVVFLFCLKYTFGNVRFYIIAASAFGVYIFRKIFNKSFEKIFSFLLFPLSFLIGKINNRSRKKTDV